MNLYAKTFAAIKPHWKRLASASTSAALHAIMSGMLLWMIGPLLMTLFQVSSVPIIGQELAPEAATDGSSAVVGQSWIEQTKERRSQYFLEGRALQKIEFALKKDQKKQQEEGKKRGEGEKLKAP